MAQYREFMATKLVRNPVVQNPRSKVVQNLEIVTPSPPPENNQNNQQGDMLLLKRFKHCSPLIIKGTTDSNEAEDWITEMKKCFKILKCIV